MALLRATQSALERTRDHKFFTYLVWVISQWCRWTVCVCMSCWLRKCTAKGCHWLRQWLRIFRWCFMLARSAIIILPSSSTHPSHWPLSTPLICSTAQHNCTTSLKLQYLSFRWLLSSVPDINESCLFALIHSLIHSQSTLPGTSIDKWSVTEAFAASAAVVVVPFSFPSFPSPSLFPAFLIDQPVVDCPVLKFSFLQCQVFDWWSTLVRHHCHCHSAIDASSYWCTIPFLCI